jgi:hypothetical protein
MKRNSERSQQFDKSQQDKHAARAYDGLKWITCIWLWWEFFIIEELFILSF